MGLDLGRKVVSGQVFPLHPYTWFDRILLDFLAFFEGFLGVRVFVTPGPCFLNDDPKQQGHVKSTQLQITYECVCVYVCPQLVW